MEPLTLGIIGIIVFFVLIMLELPIAISMILVGTVGIFIIRSADAAFQIMSDSFVTTFTSYTLGVVPMFVLMGELATQSKLGSSIFGVVQKYLGHMRGGLAIAVQGVCALFGAICGSLPATTAMMGGVAYPEMKKYNYSDMLSTGSIAAGSALAILIPPSLTYIVYGLTTEQSIGKLFISGITVGTLLMLLYMATVSIWTKIDPSLAPVVPKVSWADRIHSLRHGGLIEVGLVFLVSMGGLFLGWFTPTEAGAVGSVGMLLVAILFKRFTIKVLVDSVKNTIMLACVIYFIMAAATILGKFIALSGIPAALGSWVAGLGVPRLVVMLLITVIYFILGCLIDSVTMILLTIPIFYPLVTGPLGFDGIWFGSYIILTVALGAMTPPMGFSCFVLQSAVKDVPLTTIFRGVVPFVFACLVCMIILIVFPPIVSWLPSVVYN